MKKGALSIAAIVFAVNFSYAQTEVKPELPKSVAPVNVEKTVTPDIQQTNPPKIMVQPTKPPISVVLPPKPTLVIKPAVTIPQANSNAVK